jgi:hypothetical protein|nr:MAG TPA: Protein of unknown function (DUF1642) [Caudoviricetes sp.]
MNKRELIEHINNTLFDNLKGTFFTEPTFSITESAKDNKVAITFETEQVGVLVGGMLKKFEKVTIPQFAADFIAEQKKLGHTLSYSIDASMSDRVAEWYWDNSELFARAWLDGYGIEKEKRYLVKMKGVDLRTNYLYYGVGSKTWLFKAKLIDGNFRKSHTRKELEQDNFGWVFDCTGIEIEEAAE